MARIILLLQQSKVASVEMACFFAFPFCEDGNQRKRNEVGTFPEA